MDGRNIEPRTVLWAVAEIWCDDPAGQPLRVPATLEDTSPSGACIRLKTPITVGSRITVKWHREQFSAVTKNCRTDGSEYLLGVRREPARTLAGSTPQFNAQEKPAPKVEQDKSPIVSLPEPQTVKSADVAPEPTAKKHAFAIRPSELGYVAPIPRVPSQPKGSSPPQERKGMLPKRFFPKFWQREQEGTDAPDRSTHTEAPVNKSQSHPADSLTGSPSNLLSYDDIYHAAGILNPRSGYGVHKVVDMLNSDRIRELSKEIKRASVLMALDAAGTSPDDLLRDATQRQQALDSYEAGQQKQLEEFEARKVQENAKIQAELDRVTAHYAERIKQNQDQVVREKEALRAWQMAKQYESQRISEVIELCAKQPAAVANPQPPAGGASTSLIKPQPNESAKASAGH